jgi:hypothetical protein
MVARRPCSSVCNDVLVDTNNGRIRSWSRYNGCVCLSQSPRVTATRVLAVPGSKATQRPRTNVRAKVSTWLGWRTDDGTLGTSSQLVASRSSSSAIIRVCRCHVASDGCWWRRTEILAPDDHLARSHAGILTLQYGCGGYPGGHLQAGRRDHLAPMWRGPVHGRRHASSVSWQQGPRFSRSPRVVAFVEGELP